MLHAVKWDEEQRRRVGRAIKRRRHELGISQDEAVDRAGKGAAKPVWSIIENGRQDSFKPRTLAAICRALDWQPDSLERIAAGEDPIAVGGPRAGDSPQGVTVVDTKALLALHTAIERTATRLDELVPIVRRLQQDVREFAESTTTVLEQMGERLDRLERGRGRGSGAQ